MRNAKKTLFFLFIFGCFFIQNIFASRLTKLALFSSHEGFSGAENSLQEFKIRFSEIKNDSDYKNIAGFDRWLYFGNYAGSKNSLQEFKRRFSEIKNDSDYKKNVAKGYFHWLYF